MFQSLKRLIQGEKKSASRPVRRPRLEGLEKRDLMAVDVVGDTMVITGTTGNDTVELYYMLNPWSWETFPAVTMNGEVQAIPSNVTKVEFRGLEGNDYFSSTGLPALQVSAWGGVGNDTLIGGNKDDMLWGGPGRDVVKGMGGNDQLFLGNGWDQGSGGSGDDLIRGGADTDFIVGGPGRDKLYGDNGNDTLISLDGGEFDNIDGGMGQDRYWMDAWNPRWSPRVRLEAPSFLDAGERALQQRILSFDNDADMSFDGDNLVDPIDGDNYQSFADRPLFSSQGPGRDDIFQGNTRQDCWLLSGLGSLASKGPAVIRQRVLDLMDGTYLVRLGSRYYRVDADLPTDGAGNPTNAGLGREESLWVAIVEKAYTWHRDGFGNYPTEAKYQNVDWGVNAELFKAINQGDVVVSEYWQQWSDSAPTQGVARLQEIDGRLKEGKAVLFGVDIPGWKSNLSQKHDYMVVRVNRDAAGNLVSLTVRNPRGKDTDGTSGSQDGVDDGYVTVTAESLGYTSGWIYWFTPRIA